MLVKYLQAPGNAHTDTDVAAGVLYVYRVKGVDPFGYPLEASEPVEIRAEAAPAENNPASGAPTISGTAQVGETLTADTSGITDEDGLDNVSFTYQWLADGTAISGATGSTYILVADDEGKTIKVKVSFTDDNSNEESLTSAATGAVAAAPPTNNEATGAPTISGTVKVGHVLTADITGIADQDGLDNASFDYQWLAEDSPIPGATASAYLLVAADKGRAITVKVSFTDDGDSDESLTSAATAVVTTSPLTVGLEHEPADHDGSNTFTFELRFSEEFYVSYLTLRDDALAVDGGEVTKARRLESDSITRNVRWEITVRPTGDGDVTIVLPETTDCDAEGAICTGDDRMLTIGDSTTVPGPEEQEDQQDDQEEQQDDPPETVPTDPPAAPTNLTGLIDADGNITITWTGPGGDSITGYQILRRRPQWEEHELEVYVDDTGNTAISYTDTGTPENTLYVYRVKARNAAGLSEWSNFVKIDKANHG